MSLKITVDPNATCGCKACLIDNLLIAAASLLIIFIGIQIYKQARA